MSAITSQIIAATTVYVPKAIVVTGEHAAQLADFCLKHIDQINKINSFGTATSSPVLDALNTANNVNAAIARSNPERAKDVGIQMFEKEVNTVNARLEGSAPQPRNVPTPDQTNTNTPALR